MTDPFVAEIRMFGGNFAPTGWALCAGQLLPIAQNTALFSLLGTMYGGDGKVTFGLPNLNGRVAVHSGQGPGLSAWFQGEQRGSETVTLLQSELPAHAHQARGSSDDDNSLSPVGALAGAPQSPLYRPDTDGQMAPLPLAGGSQPHNNMQPYLAITYIIALQGIFPPRS